MTNIKTARATYKIVRVNVVDGKIVITAKSKSGTARILTRKDVTTVRWHAALADYFRRQRALRAV